MLALLVKDKSFKKKLIESGNKYIENNIVLPENLTDYETVLENQVSNKLSADKIIKILEFYLLKLKVNKYVQQTTENILLPEDLDTDSDVGKS